MGYTSIVCGVTGSPHGQKAALEAARLAKENNAKLVYVYAVDISFLKTGVSLELSHTFAEESLERLGGHILDHAERIALSQGVSPRKVIRKGSVFEVLKRIVSEEMADLLVLGHEDRTTIERALLKGDVEGHVEELKQQTGVEVAVVR